MLYNYYKLPRWIGEWLRFFGLAESQRLLGCFEIVCRQEIDKEVDMGDYKRTYHMYLYKLRDRYDSALVEFETVLPITDDDCILIIKEH